MKSIEKFYDMPMGTYCGVLLREKTAKKLAKLLYKQSQEIKELLASNLDQIEISEWTLVYPDVKQEIVRYYSESTDQEKIERISVIDKVKTISYCEDGVFIANGSKEAKEEYMEWYRNSQI